MRLAVLNHFFSVVLYYNLVLHWWSRDKDIVYFLGNLVCVFSQSCVIFLWLVPESCWSANHLISTYADHLSHNNYIVVMHSLHCVTGNNTINTLCQRFAPLVLYNEFEKLCVTEMMRDSTGVDLSLNSSKAFLSTNVQKTQTLCKLRIHNIVRIKRP